MRWTSSPPAAHPARARASPTRCRTTEAAPATTSSARYDVAVVGAGILGLATANELLRRDPALRIAGAPDAPRIVPFRGDYYVLRPARAHLVRGLVYPVADPRFPFLGIHFTRRIDGAVWLGPNAVLAFAREGYRRRDVNAADLLGTLAYRGFRRMARRYWRTALAEMHRDVRKSAFLEALRAYMPELRADDLLPGPSGVRAQAVGHGGELLDDFAFDTVGRLLSVRNAPSPAATSSLALARVFADRLGALA